jgi:hypothetical protein
MSLIKKPVGPEVFGDGAPKWPRLTDGGASAVDEYCGKYYELCARGNLFIYTTAAAGIVLTTVAATNQFTIWNPAGSGKYFVPLVIKFGWNAGAGNVIAGHIAYYSSPNVGNAVGLPISVFTDIAPVSASLGNNRKVATMRFSVVNTLPAAPILLRPSKFSLLQGRDATADAPFIMIEDLAGSIVITPGNTFAIAGDSAIIPNFVISVIGAELPIPLVA